MQVLNDNLILKEDETDAVSAGGIHLAPGARNTNIIRRGTILEVGLGCPTEETKEDLKPGKEVLFDARDRIEVQVNGGTYVVVKLEKIVAVLE